MVAQARASTTLNQPQSQQPQPAAAPAAVAVSAEDEALKRNTDCVYFLASPLTCKKGNECEYRHSEYARMNPRDCYYWLNGNCLNPKCAFRHPPLDGLLGTQGAASSAPSYSTSQTAAAINATYKPRTQVAAINAPYYTGNQLAGTSAAYNPGKQAVPCVFFQNGQCAKGERCAFSHGLNPATNKVVQAPAATPGTEPSVLKKEFGGLKKCGQEQQKFPQVNFHKPTEVPTILKPAALSKHTLLPQKNVQTPMRFNDEISSDTERNVPPVTDGNTVMWSDHTLQNEVSDDHSLQNGNDADELYRESSPGFDVLVEDELRNSDYYNKDDQFGSRIHEGRNLNDYDVDRSAMADVDRETFHGPRDYDSYDRMQGQYDWKHHRASSERRSMGSDHMERKGYRKGESPERINGSDLRHRLSKKRANGLRSVINHDYNHDEERIYRDSRKDTRHESSFGGRLRGRINISGRSSPVDDDIRFSERDLDRGRMTFSSSHQGRLQNRLKGRVQEDFDNDHGNLRSRRDMMTDTRTDFSGPKRLAELKVSKGDESKEQDLFLREKPKSMNREGRHQPSDCDLSFEGPKPLSEILKRKRGVETSVSADNMDNNPKQKSIRSSITWASEKEGTKAHDSKVEIDGVNPIQKSEYGQSSQVANDTELEAEEGMIEDEGLEDHELEAYDQGNEELDYDQADGGDYTLDEGDNADLEEEYLEDEEEDADDFAKKIGVMFS